MKPVPDEVKYVCESVRIPAVNLREASLRVLNPVQEEPLTGWPRIHENIRNFRST